MKKKRTKMITRTITLLLITVIVCLLFRPIFKSLKFGLDLQGGFEILYKVSPLDGSKMNKSKLNATYKSMVKRIDTLGVSEPEIVLEGNDKIRVKLAGVSNQEDARKALSTVASLSFRDADDKLLMTGDVLKAGGAKVGQDSKGRPAVALSIKDKDEFFKVTNRVKDYEKNMIVIWLDFEEGVDSYNNEQQTCGTSESSHCLSAASVSQGFASDVIIQGDFTEEEVSDLVDLINSGSLPTKLTELSSQTVGASFGDATLEKTLIAGIIGIVCIIVMLFIIYHFSGLISMVSILLYTLSVFFVFWLVGGVLTLPGIAALILGIGMAIDANVLLYARIKEELSKGRSLSNAFKNGSKSSFKTILDANLTTLLVAIIMFVFGESSVKGFATMLIINIAVTMVTMVAITRFFMKLFIKTGYFDDKINLFIHSKKKEEKKKTRDYLALSKYFIGLSCVFVLLGGIFLGTKGLNLGIDYQAGSDINLVTNQKLKESELKKDLKELGLKEVAIEKTSDETAIRIKDILAEDKVDSVKNYFQEKYDAKVDIGVVSNVVKQDLIKNAIFATLVSLLGIILYITLRFRFSYGLCSVLCLLHDVLLMFMGMALFQIEVNSMFIAAVLAIIGYSINNTIVVFDRVRENLGKDELHKVTYQELLQITNQSMKDTMLRSIYTSLTTIIPVIALIFLGSREILTFNIAMCIGLVAGTYSSLFIACFLWVKLVKGKVGKKEKKKYKEEVQEKIIKGIND